MSFAHDPHAQELAERIERHQQSAEAEFEALRKARASSLKVGAALQHAKQLKKADQYREELLACAKEYQDAQTP